MYKKTGRQYTYDTHERIRKFNETARSVCKFIHTCVHTTRNSLKYFNKTVRLFTALEMLT